MSRRKARLNHIEADPEQFAIVAVYTAEIQHVDESGTLIGQETRPGKKVVNVRPGFTIDEIPAIARDVVEQCKYIPSSRVGEVERCLCMLADHEQQMLQMHQMQQMQQQQQAPPQQQQQQQQQYREDPRQQQRQQGGGQYYQEPPQQRMAYQEPLQERPPGGDRPAKPPKRQEPLLPDADIRKVDDYQEQLYEDKMDHKVIGAKRILSVCTDATTLELLCEHDTLLGVLSRELKENSKRSFELSVAIVCTFLCFSHFYKFHSALMQHQCGNVIMRVFEYESERSQVRKQDMDRRTMRFQELGEGATAEDKKLLAKDEKKYKLQVNRQNKLMHVALMALLNLAEEISIEKKMVNRSMAKLLTQVLDRAHEGLVLSALSFMKKLSVFEENKDQMSTPETLSKLILLAKHDNPQIALVALRVLYNFSFDEALRSSLIESGIVKLLVDLLRIPHFRHIVLRLLYHFSMDDKCKSLMAFHPDGMIMLLQLVVHFPQPRVGTDLVALVVNLSTHPRAAEVMVGSGLFPQVMLRVLKTRDPLLCKLIRHCSSHRGVLEQMFEVLQSESVRMSKWMHEFVRMAPNCVDNPDLLVEALGILVNVTLEDIPWGELCEAGLIDLLTRLLVPGFSEDDIVLECVMLVGNLGLMRESAQYVASSRLPSLLQQVLVEKRDDEEIVVQLLYTFQCLLTFEEVRDIVLSETELAPCVMRFARSNSPAVLEQATKTLQQVADLMGEGGQEWAEQIKAFRFEQHNAEWCRYLVREMSGVGMSPGGYGCYDEGQPGGQGYYDEGQPGGQGYYDEAQSGGEEEEFAFRWAGGGAADAADLAERDWGNKDVDSFMHTARHMSIS